MQDAVRTHHTAMIHHSVAINLRVVAHFDMRANRHVRMNHHPVAYLCAFADGHERPHVAVLAHLSRLVDKCKRVDAHPLLLHALIELQEFGYRLVGVIDSHQRSRYGLLWLKVLIDKHDRRFRLVDIMFVLRISQE